MKLFRERIVTEVVDKSVDFVNNQMDMSEILPKITKNTKVINRNLHFRNSRAVDLMTFWVSVPLTNSRHIL